MRKTSTAAATATAPLPASATATTASAATGDAARRLSSVSTSSVASAASGAATAVPRYSWHGDVAKTRVLLRLVNDTVAHKPAHQRRVTTSEWEVILDAFNREVAPPAESARVLHNRFSNLRVQCKAYHRVVRAQRRGLLGSVDAWVRFLQAQPALRKWRKKPFELYDEMVEALRLQGDDLDNAPEGGEDGDEQEDEPEEEEVEDDDRGHNDAAAASQAPWTKPKPVAKRRRVTSASAALTTTAARTRSPPAPAPQRVAANAPNGVVSISHYPAALRHLAALALPLEDRVDAKRFLVADGNAQAFIYMDDAERRVFLQKYCFDRREAQRRDADAQDATANHPSPSSTASPSPSS